MTHLFVEERYSQHAWSEKYSIIGEDNIYTHFEVLWADLVKRKEIKEKVKVEANLLKSKTDCWRDYWSMVMSITGYAGGLVNCSWNQEEC